MNSYDANRSWSDQFLPDIKRIVERHPLEVSPDPLDWHQAIDLLMLDEIVRSLVDRLLDQKAGVDWIIRGSNRTFERNDLDEVTLYLKVADVSAGAVRFEGSYGLHQSADCADPQDLLCANPLPVILVNAGNCELQTRIPFTKELSSYFYFMGNGPENEAFFNATETNFGLFLQDIDVATMRRIDSFTVAETHQEQSLFLRML